MGTEIAVHGVRNNVFAAFGEWAGRGSSIIGERLNFTKGDWVYGKTGNVLPLGTRLIAIMPSLAVGHVCWREQRPVDTKMGLLVEGFKPQARDELGDTDPGMWELDDAGRPRDPWAATNHLQLVDPKDPERIFTYVTSSKGGLAAIASLASTYGREIPRGSREDQFPLVELGCSSYQHSNRAYGRIKTPVLNLIGWVFKDGSPVPIDEIQY
jgi:hypothetical protein